VKGSVILFFRGSKRILIKRREKDKQGKKKKRVTEGGRKNGYFPLDLGVRQTARLRGIISKIEREDN